MKRIQLQYSFSLETLHNIKAKVLAYVSHADTFAFLDNNSYNNNLVHRFELLAGCQPIKIMNPAETLTINDWILGQVDYEYRFNSCDNNNHVLFIPQTVIYIPHNTSTLIIETYSPDFKIDDILNEDIIENDGIPEYVKFSSVIPKDIYIDTIHSIKKDIFYGKYYEINYCIPFQFEKISLQPISIFQLQNNNNPSPFAALFRHHQSYILCTSPERFVYKENNDIYCQPIKGTIKKGKNHQENEALKEQLFQDEKERAENVMIVDLTRSDLAQCCEVGSIQVPDLFGIYEYPYVYQMISTIKGKLTPSYIKWYNIMQKIYPMGSMTGAPKPMVQRCINEYEKTPRGAYSGCIFYITPDGDFDSNVVIRSLIYNDSTHDLHYHVGSAITYDSNPEKEWEELLLKASSIINIFNKKQL